MPPMIDHFRVSVRRPSSTLPSSSKTMAVTPGSQSSWWPAEARMVRMKSGVAMERP
jgi:hypothetical protein